MYDTWEYRSNSENNVPEVTYYNILGIERDATQHQIKIAYRKIARKYHPDVNKSVGAGAKMESANAAYDNLRDPVKRAAYDWSLFGRSDGKSEAAQNAAAEAEELARREAQRKAAAEAEELARREAQRKAAAEAEQLARREAQRKAAAEAEQLARREAQRKAAAEAEELARREAEKQTIQGILYIKQQSVFTLDLKAFHIFIVSNKFLLQAPGIVDKDDRTAKIENARAQFISRLVGGGFFSRSAYEQSVFITLAFCIITLMLGLIHRYDWIYVSLLGAPVFWRVSYLLIKKIKGFNGMVANLSATQKKSILKSSSLAVLISIPLLVIIVNYSFLWLFVFVPLVIFIWELSYRFLLKVSGR